ncbi:MAG: NADH-quinone oxidoreductase subunit B family protein [Chloroflexota bacterium]
MLKRLLQWARRKSPWILHFNTGGCNGCDIEILDLLTPRYDVERLGILKEASPRHADILLCTGPVTRQSRARLRRIYEQMPEPKWVVAVGTCACSGGVFRGSYNMMGGIDQVIPVDLYIPGCPPRPEAIIGGLARLLEEIEGTKEQQEIGIDPAAAEQADSVATDDDRVADP